MGQHSIEMRKQAKSIEVHEKRKMVSECTYEVTVRFDACNTLNKRAALHKRTIEQLIEGLVKEAIETIKEEDDDEEDEGIANSGEFLYEGGSNSPTYEGEEPRMF